MRDISFSRTHDKVNTRDTSGYKYEVMEKKRISSFENVSCYIESSSYKIGNSNDCNESQEFGEVQGSIAITSGHLVSGNFSSKINDKKVVDQLIAKDITNHAKDRGRLVRSIPKWGIGIIIAQVAYKDIRYDSD